MLEAICLNINKRKNVYTIKEVNGDSAIEVKGDALLKAIQRNDLTVRNLQLNGRRLEFITNTVNKTEATEAVVNTPISQSAPIVHSAISPKINTSILTAENILDASLKTETHKDRWFTVNRSFINKINSEMHLSFKITPISEEFESKMETLGYVVSHFGDTTVFRDGYVTTVINPYGFKLDNCDADKGIFYNTKFLSIDLENVDTSEVTSMRGLFENCQATSLNIETIDTSNVTDMSRMFNNCKAYHINLGNFVTDKVQDMSLMFRGMKVERLDLSHFDFRSISTMASMFVVVETGVISLDNTSIQSNVDMSSMFLGCRAVMVKLNNMHIGDNCNMMHMFNSSKIDRIDARNIDIVGNVRMDYMFLHCGHIALTSNNVNMIKEYSEKV